MRNAHRVRPVLPCPYPDCARNLDGDQGKVVAYGTFAGHRGRREQRWRCGCCRRTFNERTGTPLARLRAPETLISLAVQQHSEGLSKAAIARTLRFAPSTITRWIDCTAAHVRTFHDVRTRPEEVGELQMDELRCKGTEEARNAWVYSAIEVFTRLWVGLQVSRRTLRNTRAFTREVMNALQASETCAIVTSDGMKYYEPAMRRVFKNFPVVYQQVDNVYRGGRVVRSTPRIVFGSRLVFEDALQRTESRKPNTAYIERLNLVQRTCCSMLRRKTPTPARRIASLQSALEIVRVIYNYVRPHASLKTLSGKQTPAMAAGLASRPLTMGEILRWRPPSWWWREKMLREEFAKC